MGDHGSRPQCDYGAAAEGLLRVRSSNKPIIKLRNRDCSDTLFEKIIKSRCAKIHLKANT